MSGETSDISQFCEFAFYDWIMFRDQPVAFPDDNPVLGRFLGPAIDVGHVLTSKILKANGEVIYRSTYRTLTDVERANAVHVCSQSEINLNILDKFGPETTPDDFPDLDIPDTPELNNFDDVDYADRDDKWVKRWRAFTGDVLTGNADDEIPTQSLGVDIFSSITWRPTLQVSGGTPLRAMTISWRAKTLVIIWSCMAAL